MGMKISIKSGIFKLLCQSANELNSGLSDEKTNS